MRGFNINFYTAYLVRNNTETKYFDDNRENKIRNFMTT